MPASARSLGELSARRSRRQSRRAKPFVSGQEPAPRVAGRLFPAPPGNDGSNAGTFPAGDRRVIGVSATDQNDALASWSNYGPSIFMAAPGVGIASTYPGASYVTWDGTSASAAIVAGSAALMRAADPSLANGVIVNRMARTADPAGTQDQTGNGRVNIARALADTSTDSIQPAGSPPVGRAGSGPRAPAHPRRRACK